MPDRCPRCGGPWNTRVGCTHWQTCDPGLREDQRPPPPGVQLDLLALLAEPLLQPGTLCPMSATDAPPDWGRRDSTKWATDCPTCARPVLVRTDGKIPRHYVPKARG